MHSRTKTHHLQVLDAHWLFTLLELGRPGQAYNVGSDEVISIADLAHLVRDILAPDKPVHILGQPDPGATRNRYLPDIRKARQQLGLSVTVPLAEAIRRTGASAVGLGPAEQTDLS
jgi:dTDP-glucose 4,6-dehydratase